MIQMFRAELLKNYLRLSFPYFHQHVLSFSYADDSIFSGHEFRWICLIDYFMMLLESRCDLDTIPYMAHEQTAHTYVQGKLYVCSAPHKHKVCPDCPLGSFMFLRRADDVRYSKFRPPRQL